MAASGSGHRTVGKGGSAFSGSKNLRVPHLSIHASSASSMRGQRISSGSGGGGGGGGSGANALVSFAPHGYSPSPSQASELLDFQRGNSWAAGGEQSRANTAPGADGVGASVFRSRVSSNFRQALAEAKERTATRRLTTQQVREQRRSNNQPESVSRLDGDTLVEEDDVDLDAGEVFDEVVAASPRITEAALASGPPDPGSVSDPRRRRALRRWGLMRDVIDEIHRERHAKKTEGWSMFFKHVRAMSEAEKTRQDLYDRYNIFGDGKSDFMTNLPAIPDELLLAAGIPLPSNRARRQNRIVKRPPKR